MEQRSDDAKLARALIAQLQDQKWALEQAQIEDEANCNISTGGSTKYLCRLAKKITNDKNDRYSSAKLATVNTRVILTHRQCLLLGEKGTQELRWLSEVVRETSPEGRKPKPNQNVP